MYAVRAEYTGLQAGVCGRYRLRKQSFISCNKQHFVSPQIAHCAALIFNMSSGQIEAALAMAEKTERGPFCDVFLGSEGRPDRNSARFLDGYQKRF
jgi:hypothetical protein